MPERQELAREHIVFSTCAPKVKWLIINRL